ncbi:putative UROD/MetE-like superfamily protein [Helianthus anomalus]
MTIFADITKATTSNERCLQGVEVVEDIPHLDWCSYLPETLRRTRQGWKNTKIQYVGPVSFLLLLYTHEYNKRHRLFEQVVEMQVICYFTSKLIDKAEEHISNNGPLTDNEVENDFEPDQ